MHCMKLEHGIWLISPLENLLLDDTVDLYKARLVARGFTQEYEIDYEETFALVAQLSSVSTLIAVFAARKWPLFQ